MDVVLKGKDTRETNLPPSVRKSIIGILKSAQGSIHRIFFFRTWDAGNERITVHSKVPIPDRSIRMLAEHDLDYADSAMDSIGRDGDYPELGFELYHYTFDVGPRWTGGVDGRPPAYRPKKGRKRQFWEPKPL